jgi:hypothetical protein
MKNDIITLKDGLSVSYKTKHNLSVAKYSNLYFQNDSHFIGICLILNSLMLLFGDEAGGKMKERPHWIYISKEI